MLNEGQIIKNFTSKKGNAVILRAPKTEDVVSITAMINSVIKEDDYILLNKKQELDSQVDWLGKRIKNNKEGNQVYLVAEVNGKIVGSADVGKGIGRCEHVGGFGIAIMNGFREEGIGTEIMNTVLDYAKEKMGIKIAKLVVYKNNERARNLYKKLGFIEFGELPKEIKIGDSFVSGVYMYKEL